MRNVTINIRKEYQNIIKNRLEIYIFIEKNKSNYKKINTLINTLFFEDYVDLLPILINFNLTNEDIFNKIVLQYKKENYCGDFYFIENINKILKILRKDKKDFDLLKKILSSNIFKNKFKRRLIIFLINELEYNYQIKNVIFIILNSFPDLLQNATIKEKSIIISKLILSKKKLSNIEKHLKLLCNGKKLNFQVFKSLLIRKPNIKIFKNVLNYIKNNNQIINLVFFKYFNKIKPEFYNNSISNYLDIYYFLLKENIINEDKIKFDEYDIYIDLDNFNFEFFKLNYIKNSIYFKNSIYLSNIIKSFNSSFINFNFKLNYLKIKKNTVLQKNIVNIKFFLVEKTFNNENYKHLIRDIEKIFKLKINLNEKILLEKKLLVLLNKYINLKNFDKVNLLAKLINLLNDNVLN